MIDLTEHLPDLPADLREKAFSVGSIPWPAWTVPEALAVIAHLRSRSLAVTWLYSVTETPTDSWTHYTTQDGDYYSDYNPYIEAEENWGDFVERTCSEADDLLRSFHPLSPITTLEPFRIGFLVMWEAEEALPALREQCEARVLANRPALSLEDEIAQFRRWADARPGDWQYTCWEVNYYNWPQIGQAFDEFLAKEPFQHWNDYSVANLLYIIARDNDARFLVHTVAKEPERLLFLAEAAVASPEHDAKWQFAEEISQLDRQQYAVEPVLLAMSVDKEEYVRRQALMALGRVQSPLAEPLALVAWETGEEYQRMAALQVLHELDSRLVGDYFVKAEQDESQHLRRFAARLKVERPSKAGG